MNLLKEFLLDDNCSYLDEKFQTLHYKVIDQCNTIHCQELIERGFRRFGKMYFRPICKGCDECKSIKIDVDNFIFTKSRRRVLNKAQKIKSFIQKPSLSREHLALFKKYHLFMNEKKAWSYQETSPEHYYSSFVDGHNDFGYEVLYFYEDKLIGVDLIDILEEGISSIYFYYDPDFSYFSLGKLSLLNQIKYAKKTNKKWIYLGYYVKECPSLSYKSEYEPYLTLEGKPSEYEKYIWS